MTVTAAPSTRIPSGRWSARGWALGLSLAATVPLGAVSHLLFLADAMAYGMASIISPESELEAPALAPYVSAFCAASVVAVVGSLLLTMAMERTAAAGWPSAARGLLAGATSSVTAALTVFALLGFSPLSLLG